MTGTARMIHEVNHTVPPFMASAIGSVIQRAGEILVVGEQVPGLAGSAAIGLCGYVGTSHVEYTIELPHIPGQYGVVVPAYRDTPTCGNAAR